MNTENIFIYIIIILFPVVYFIIHFINQLYERRQKLNHRIGKILPHITHYIESRLVPSKALTKQNLIERKLKQYLLRNPKKVDLIKLWLYQSDLKIEINGLLTIFGVIWVTTSLFLILLSFSNPLLIIVGTLFAQALLFYLVIQFRVRRKKNKTISELAHAVDIIARGIKAGSTIEKTFIIVAREINGPLKTEFIRITHELDFGIPFETVMHSAANRINIPDFFFFTSALVIQRKSGGSLSEVLDNIVLMLNKAKEMRMKIKVFSAESKGSAAVLTCIPVVVWFIMMSINPEYLSFFLNDPLGKKLLILVMGLIAATIITVKKITKIEI